MKLSNEDFKNVPIFGASQRPVKKVTKDELKDSGVAFAAYGISVGEIIQFPENASEHLYSQPTVPGGKNMQILVGCKRGTSLDNLKTSYFTMGSLIRQDGHRQYTCEFTKNMAENHTNHEQRLDVLAGKTIKGTEALQIEVVKFDTATRMPMKAADGAVVMEQGKATKIEFV